VAGTLGEIVFFLALVVVIVIHEAAHLGMAKRFGIKVEEFFVGFGPKIWSFRRGETEYGLKAIPAGGYVRIAGMNPFQPPREADLPRTFGAKLIWQRALVIAAGPATHFVLAFLFFALWLGVAGRPVAGPNPVVDSVSRTLNGVTSPAAAAGLRPGDRIVGVGPIEDPTDLQIVRYTRARVGESVPFRIRRDGREFEVEITPVLSAVEGERVGRIGVLLRANQRRERAGALSAIAGAGGELGRTVAGTVQGFARIFGPEGVGRLLRLLFTNAPRSVHDPASVIGIGRAVGETASAGTVWDLLYIFGLVNVFIGLLNLIPLPPFDGGHLAVLAIEKLRGRKVDMRKLVPISAAVAAFFVLFTFAVVYLDIAKPISLSP
jgi:membrane-associated protease RseP (regulator of RpoE activity)